MKCIGVLPLSWPSVFHPSAPVTAPIPPCQQLSFPSVVNASLPFPPRWPPPPPPHPAAVVPKTVPPIIYTLVGYGGVAALGAIHFFASYRRAMVAGRWCTALAPGGLLDISSRWMIGGEDDVLATRFLVFQARPPPS